MDLTGVNKLSTPNVGKANLSVRWGWRKGVPLRKMHKFHLVEGLWVPLFVPVGDARRYLVPVGRYRVPTGADIGYRG